MKIFLPFIIVAAALLVIVSPGVQKLSGTADVASAAVTPTPDPTAAVSVDAATPPDDTWVKDADVTFVGKTAARSGAFLDWSLTNYNWVSLGTTDTNPLIDFWRTVRNIVYAFFSLFVLITAFVIMVTRGKNITVMRFIPRFIGIILLVTFSFAVVQFFYQVFDIIQGFFLRNPDCFANSQSATPFVAPSFCSVSDKITQANLLNIGFSYGDFIGYRKVGVGNDEGAIITLLLTKLTAITYYVMVGVLIVRKIILWFFIIISPIFPLLLLYRPVRNTGKIWVGEFFRWLLYAPLFSVLLAGLVSLWRAGVPLFQYDPTSGDVVSKAVVNNVTQVVGRDMIYPTAVNILLGGPRANISLQNSVNLPETFALYVICLIMLWVVIILPFILLRIFLDYAFSVSLSENNSVKQIMSMANSFINKPPSPASPVGPQNPPAGAGLARALPFTKRFSIPEGVARVISDRPASVSRNTTTQTNTNTTTNTNSIRSRLAETFTNTNRSQISSVKETSEITKLTNLSVPTMRDIAKYETAQLSTKTMQTTQVAQVNQSLQKIANPTQTTSPVEREKYVEVREKLVTESQKGNVLATTILNAANTMSHSSVTNNHTTNNSVVKTVFKQLANPERIPNATEREQYTQVKGKIVEENQNGNQVAASLLAYINNLSENTLSSTQNISVDHVQKFLKNISSPISITDNTTKNTYTQLREQLETQSKQGNSLATNILGLSNTATTSSPEQLTQLKDQLVAAQKTGDPLATSVLSNVQKETGDIDVEKVREKLMQAKEKGDKVATVLLSLVDAKQQTGKAATPSPSLPVVNRLQTVSLDDYEAVKKTWRDSYKNIEVPQKMDKVQTRKEWIQSDVTQITSTINLLSSPDAEKRAEGMKEVSGILPFLLIGGFSQNEIIAYLKAKLEAAKDVSGDLEEKEEEEGSLVDTQRKTTAHPQSMHMSTEVKIPEPTNTSTSSTTSSESDDEMPSQLRAAAQTVNIQSSTPSSQPAMSSSQPSTVTYNYQILQLTNLSIPTMKDIARFETAHLTNTPQTTPEAATMQNTLINIASPIAATTPSDQQRFQTIREKLVTESQKGDSLATSILNAANSISTTSSSTQNTTVSQDITNQNMMTVITQLAHPDGIPSPEIKEKVLAVKTQLLEAKEKGDPIASQVLDIVDHPEQSEKTSQLKEQLISEKKNGNQIASATLSLVPAEGESTKKGPSTVSLPTTNRIQSVSVEDYESVKKIWKDNYTSIPVPQINGKMVSRQEWISRDTQDITNTISQLSSVNKEEQEEGMKKVSEILPFLLIGGFSQSEVVTYLKAKLEAAKDVSEGLNEKEKEENSFVEPDHTKEAQTQSMHMSADIPVRGENQKNEPVSDRGTSFVPKDITLPNTEASSAMNTQSIPQKAVNSQLLSLTNLSIPTMKDIARFETAHLEKQSDKTPEVGMMKESLEKIAAPQLASQPDEQQKYQQIREKLTTDSQSGDALAASILAAATTFAKEKSPAETFTTPVVEQILSQLNAPEAVSEVPLREHVTEVRNELMEEKNRGNSLAAMVVSAATEPTKKTPETVNAIKEQVTQPANVQNPVTSLLTSLVPQKEEEATKTLPKLPDANRIQSVSVEDYEAVKQIWKDSYKTVAYPQIEGKLTDRKQWIQKDMSEINETIAMLSHTDKEKQNEGMKKVSEILPFLLIGGFSQSEVVTYLKAKLEAGKEVANDLMRKEEDEGSVLDREQRKVEKPFEMSVKLDGEQQKSADTSTAQTPLSFAKTDDNGNSNT